MLYGLEMPPEIHGWNLPCCAQTLVLKPKGLDISETWPTWEKQPRICPQLFYEFHNPPFYKSSSDPLGKLEKPTLGVKGNYSLLFLNLLNQFCSWLLFHAVANRITCQWKWGQASKKTISFPLFLFWGLPLKCLAQI